MDKDRDPQMWRQVEFWVWFSIVLVMIIIMAIRFVIVDSIRISTSMNVSMSIRNSV